MRLQHHFGNDAQAVIMTAAVDFERKHNITIHVAQLSAARMFEFIDNHEPTWLAPTHANGPTHVLPHYLSSAELVTVSAPWMAEILDGLAPLDAHLESWRRGIRGPIIRDVVREQDTAYRFPSPGDRHAQWRALPMFAGVDILAYRRDLYMKHASALNGSAPPETFDEAVQKGRIIAELEGGRMTGYGVTGGGAHVAQALLPMAMGNGTAFITPQGKCNFESPGFLPSLQYYADLLNQMLPVHRNLNIDELIKEFSAGRVVHFVGPSYDLIRRLEALDFVGFAPIPRGPRGHFTHQDGVGLAMLAGMSKACQDTAFRFMQHVVDGPYLLELVQREQGTFPAYETHYNQIRNETGVEMGAFTLYDAAQRTIPLVPEQFVTEGPAEMVLPLAGNGTWFGRSDTTEFLVHFPRGAEVRHYSFQTGVHPERHPDAWDIQVFSGGRWHNPRTVEAGDTYRDMQGAEGQWTGYLGLPEGEGATMLKFKLTRTRCTLCGEGCRAVYGAHSVITTRFPALGFYDSFPKLPSTIAQMIRDVGGGAPPAKAAHDACLALDTAGQEEGGSAGPTRELHQLFGLLLCGVIFVVIAGVVLHRSVYMKTMQTKITQLRSDNEMAEDLSKAVAVMDLDAVSYLFTIQSPTEIQQSFAQIVRTLQDYRAYLPAALLAACNAEGTDDQGGDGQDSDGRDSSSTWSYSDAASFYMYGAGPPESAAAASEDRSCADDTNAMGMGIRVKKVTVMVVNNSAGTADTSWMEPVLNCIKSHEGIPLTVRPDYVFASWNAHKVCPKHCHYAAQCAMHIQAKVASLGDGAAVTVAIASGRMQVGHFGWAQQKAPFVIGQGVSQVEHMGALAQHLQVGVLVTEQVVKNCRPLDARPVDVINTTPNDEGAHYVTVWEAMGFLDPDQQSHRSGQTCVSSNADTDYYRKAWVALRNSNYAQAHDVMTTHAKANPTDFQAVRLLRLTYLLKTDPDQVFTEGLLGASSREGYYRKFLGWRRLEGSAEPAFLVPQPPAATRGVMTSRNEGIDLRNELEKAKTTSKTNAPSCRKCEKPLRHSEHFTDLDENYVCEDCETKAAGRRWVCMQCKTCHCYKCHPHMRSDRGGAVGLCIQDRTGAEYRRSDTVLGKGAYGTVWLGMDAEGGLVAIKTVNVNPEAVRETNSLVAEVELLSCLRHDNIVSYISSCVSDSHVVIVMEFVSGGSLGFLLDQFGKVSLEALKRYVRDILLALEYLHDNGFVHRDLKPANVLLMTDGQCKLSDFGTSTTQKGTDHGSDRRSGERIVGTPVFMSPEAARGVCMKEVDIWALGISTFQLYTGQIPYTKRNLKAKQLIEALASMTAPLSSVETIEGDIGNFIQMCLVLDAKERPPASKLLLHSVLL